MHAVRYTAMLNDPAGNDQDTYIIEHGIPSHDLVVQVTDADGNMIYDVAVAHLSGWRLRVRFGRMLLPVAEGALLQWERILPSGTVYVRLVG